MATVILLEDAMMAYRIVDHPSVVFSILMLGILPLKMWSNILSSVKTQMKRNQIVDEDQGEWILRYNAMSIDEDYYIPVRGDKQ